MREFGTGATRDDNTNKPDYKGFLSARVIKRFGQYMHKHRLQADGSMRGSDNWKLGIPIEAYTESLVRHTVDFMGELEKIPLGSPEADELACAILFNVQGYLHQREVMREQLEQTQAHLETHVYDPMRWDVVDDPYVRVGQAVNAIPAAQGQLRHGNDGTRVGPWNDRVLLGSQELPRTKPSAEAARAEATHVFAGQNGRGVSPAHRDIQPEQETSKVGHGVKLYTDRDLFSNCR